MDYLYILQCLRENAPSLVNYLFLFISEFIMIGGFLIPLIMYWCMDKSYGMTILLGYASSNFVNQFIKNTACVYRPWKRDPRLYIYEGAKSTATGYSFPSGHTTAAASIYGGLAAYGKKRKWFVILMAICTLLTAFSRNWLGAHTLSDVIVAIINTCIILSITFALKYFIQANPHRDILIAGLGIIIVILSMFYLVFKSYPIEYNNDGSVYDMITDCYTASGLLIGGLIGWIIERRFIKFQMETSIGKKIFRAVIGAIVILCMHISLSDILAFLGDHWAHAIKYFLMAFVAIAVYPAIFKFLERKSNNGK